MNPLTIVALLDPWLLPPPASNLAPDVDYAWNFILWINIIFFLIVVVAMGIFVVKYRRRTPNDETSEVTHNTPIEIIWTVVPLVIVMGCFYIGFKGFMNYDTPASNSRPVEVQAQKWNFSFTYPNGAISSELYVEKDMPCVLNLHSIDVLHGCYIPAFRTQRNLIPGRTTNIWFVPTQYSPKEGFPLFCTQYCGDGHSKMFTYVHVLDKSAYDEQMKVLANPFVEKDAAGHSHFVPYVKLGESLYKKSGCTQCHSVDGSKGIGPTWKGLWKSEVTFSASNVAGYSLSASDSDQKWEEYVHESVLHPDVKIVNGFSNVMPSFNSQFGGDPKSPKNEELRAITEYIKSIGSTGYKPAITPDSNPAAFDADKNTVHPESLAAADAVKTPAK